MLSDSWCGAFPSEAGLWQQRHFWRQGPVHLWQHRRWQIPHAQSCALWWGGGVCHLALPHHLYGRRVGRLPTEPRPGRPGHRGPPRRHDPPEPPHAAAAESVGRVGHRGVPDAGWATAQRHVPFPGERLGCLPPVLHPTTARPLQPLWPGRAPLQPGARRHRLPGDVTHTATGTG